MKYYLNKATYVVTVVVNSNKLLYLEWMKDKQQQSLIIIIIIIINHPGINPRCFISISYVLPGAKRSNFVFSLGSSPYCRGN